MIWHIQGPICRPLYFKTQKEKKKSLKVQQYQPLKTGFEQHILQSWCCGFVTVRSSSGILYCFILTFPLGIWVMIFQSCWSMAVQKHNQHLSHDIPIKSKSANSKAQSIGLLSSDSSQLSFHFSCHLKSPNRSCQGERTLRWKNSSPVPAAAYAEGVKHVILISKPTGIKSLELHFSLEAWGSGFWVIVVCFLWIMTRKLVLNRILWWWWVHTSWYSLLQVCQNTGYYSMFWGIASAALSGLRHP